MPRGRRSANGNGTRLTTRKSDPQISRKKEKRRRRPVSWVTGVIADKPLGEDFGAAREAGAEAEEGIRRRRGCGTRRRVS